MKILELYSGIGGMHMAFKESGTSGTVQAAIEISPIANSVYKHNFPATKLLNSNIEGLTVEFINSLDVDTILMSPPCQPFTRNGKKCDVKDARTDSFQHVLSLLPNLHIDNILVENVKGFETSQMRNLLINTLKDNGYIYQEFLLTPAQFGVPNSRLRYYCLAMKSNQSFPFEIQDTLLKTLPGKEPETECCQIKDILENVPTTSIYHLKENVLRKRLKVLDICFKDSRRSCCFTKAYGRFIEGTGSVFAPDDDADKVTETLEKLYKMDSKGDDFLLLAQSLGLRFFTPIEISRIMCFPKSFSFPDHLSNRQKYMVLGNSINVKVVSELIKLFQ